MNWAGLHDKSSTAIGDSAHEKREKVTDELHMMRRNQEEERSFEKEEGIGEAEHWEDRVLSLPRVNLSECLGLFVVSPFHCDLTSKPRRAKHTSQLTLFSL